MKKHKDFGMVVLVVGMLFFAPSVFAATGADWVFVPVHFSWDLSMSGVCQENSQCLVHLQGSPDHDGNVARWYTATAQGNPADGPRCLNTTQYVKDYLCEQGNWTTRTKHVALQLLQVAQQTSATDFTLFCDQYDRVLNQYRYELQGTPVASYLDESCFILGTNVPCVNSMCVLQTPTAVVIGASLNMPLNDTSKSFLKALDKTITLCSTVSKTSTAFVKCKENEPVWYNPVLHSIVWLVQGTLAERDASIDIQLTQPLRTLNEYVMKFLHTKDNPAFDFSYFPRTRLFNHVYLVHKATKTVFGFLEKSIRPETDPIPLDYLGVRYDGIDLGHHPCLNIIKRYDSKAFCENQTSSGFTVIARQRCVKGAACVNGASPVVDAWSALTGKLRP